MSVLLDMPLVVVEAPDEAAARRELRRQIARLEARGGAAPRVARGPQLLSLAELERVRDGLAARTSRTCTQGYRSATFGARERLEAMIADPARHRRERVALAELGQPGCGVYRVAPRLGLIGMLAGWWHVVVSSGCP